VHRLDSVLDHRQGSSSFVCHSFGTLKELRSECHQDRPYREERAGRDVVPRSNTCYSLAFDLAWASRHDTEQFQIDAHGPDVPSGRPPVQGYRRVRTNGNVYTGTHLDAMVKSCLRCRQRTVSLHRALTTTWTALPAPWSSSSRVSEHTLRRGGL